MTADERNRIDALIQQVADWRVETKDELIAAVRTHESDCLEEHLRPLDAKLDAVAADLRDLRGLLRWTRSLFAGVVAVLGIAIPLILHYL